MPGPRINLPAGVKVTPFVRAALEEAAKYCAPCERSEIDPELIFLGISNIFEPERHNDDAQAAVRCMLDSLTLPHKIPRDLRKKLKEVGNNIYTQKQAALEYFITSLLSPDHKPRIPDGSGRQSFYLFSESSIHILERAQKISNIENLAQTIQAQNILDVLCNTDVCTLPSLDIILDKLSSNRNKIAYDLNLQNAVRKACPEVQEYVYREPDFE